MVTPYRQRHLLLCSINQMLFIISQLELKHFTTAPLSPCKAVIQCGLDGLVIIHRQGRNRRGFITWSRQCVPFLLHAGFPTRLVSLEGVCCSSLVTQGIVPKLLVSKALSPMGRNPLPQVQDDFEQHFENQAPLRYTLIFIPHKNPAGNDAGLWVTSFANASQAKKSQLQGQHDDSG